MNSGIEQKIFNGILSSDDYMRRVLPFLKEEYFTANNEKVLFNLIKTFVQKYNTRPTIDALDVGLSNLNLAESIFVECANYVSTLEVKEDTNIEWLYDETEKFCKDKAVYNAIIKSIKIIDGSDKNHSKDGIPSLLQDALGVCFDASIGHDYFNDADKRYDSYHKIESRIPFDLDIFNKITQGGLPNKTLNIALAGTGVGKSLFMCHVAASCIAQGKNVLYITLEMAEERIAERIDSNLLNTEINTLKEIPKDIFKTRIGKFYDKAYGKLVIKEYPTASAHVGHFKGLLNELALKKQFKPHIIFIDYLNICASSRFKPGGGVNSYTYIKAIAEELRGLAVEYNVPIVSATQTTRSGYSNTDVDLTDTSESFGLPATADFMFAIISTEELEQLNQIMVKQLKNRYNDPTYYKRFMIGIDRAKMRLYDVEERAQNITDPGVTDKTRTSSTSVTKTLDFSKIKI